MSHLPVVTVARTDSGFTLDAIAGANATAGNVSMNSNKITNLSAGTAAGDAVEYSQFAAALDGLSYKDAVVVATTGNITLSGEQTIDGVLTSGSRVLVKDQTTASDNGIYVSAAGAWSRADDADTAAEITDGATTWVQQGTANADTRWTVTSTVTTLGSDNVDFAQTGSAASVSVISDLTDVNDSSRVDGSLLRFESTGSVWQATTSANMLLTDAGQLQVLTNGSGGGIIIGSDTQLYRDGAGILRVANSLTVQDNLVVEDDLTTNGRYRQNAAVNNAASPYSVLATDDVILVDSSAGAVTINLPAVASMDERTLVVKDVGNAATNNVTVDGNGAETIDGAATYVINENYHSITLHCDGAEWFIL